VLGREVRGDNDRVDVCKRGAVGVTEVVERKDRGGAPCPCSQQHLAGQRTSAEGDDHVGAMPQPDFLIKLEEALTFLVDRGARSSGTQQHRDRNASHKSASVNRSCASRAERPHVPRGTTSNF
jgi:hypothetical protein